MSFDFRLRMNGLPYSEAASLLKESRVPLIIIPRAPSTDALAAGLALLLALERQGKTPHLVSPEFQLPPNHDFLPKSDAVRSTLSSLRSFIINVNVKKTKLESLSYDLSGDQLHIYLTPRNGFYEPRDVTTSAGAYAYDLIIAVGLMSFNELGALYDQNAEFFYQTPTIAIDHQASNQRFAQVNLVDVVASSSSEIVFEMLQRLDRAALDEQLATTLLTGIISNTKGFQAHSVTPRSLSIASHLITAGARRETIVRQLYQTKTLAALKLWGRALANIQSANNGDLVWTSITNDDVKQAQASPDDAVGVIDELMMNTPAAKMAALFVEMNGDVRVYISTASPQTLKLPDELSPETPTFYTGSMRGPLRAVIKQVVCFLGGPTE